MKRIEGRLTVFTIGIATILVGCESTQPASSGIQKLCSQTVDMDVEDLGLVGTWDFRGEGSSMAMANCVPAALRKMSIQFKEGGRLDGTSSCNSLTANYSSAGNTIQVTGVGVTEMMCTPENVMRWENLFVSGIEGAKAYEIVGNCLHLKTNNGRDLFFFRNED